MTGELLKAEKVLTVGTRVEFFVGEDETKYISRVEDYSGELLIVAMPTSKEGVPVIPYKGEQVYGLAIGKEKTHSRYRFMTTFESYGKEGNIPIWRIKMPSEVERFQNREFVRVKISQTTHVSFIDDEGGRSDPILTWTVDISGNGVSFLLEDPVAENTKVAVEIEGIPEIGTLSAMASVVRCVEFKRKQGDIAYLVGVKLLDLPKSKTNQIVRWLFSVQRRAIAKGINL